MTTPLLSLNNIHAGYGAIEVLKGISLEVRAGEIVTIIGANGAGKTTTLMCISGINRVRSGTITWEGREIQHLPPHEIVCLKLCQSPEGRKIFPRLTVLENLELGAVSRNDRTEIRRDLERVYNLFPFCESDPSNMAHAVRRRATDAGRGPRIDGTA